MAALLTRGPSRRAGRRAGLVAFVLAALLGGGSLPALGAIDGLVPIRGGFDQPVFVTNAGDARLFVVEKTGRIRILRRADGRWRIGRTFLDLRGRVATDGERGLLGLAFPPDHATTGRFYVDYVNRRGDIVIAELRVGANGLAAPRTRRTLLVIPHASSANHNGGWIGFLGETLLIAVGDGGSGPGPGNPARDRGSLLGKILRIDPADPDGSGPLRYGIPADNPPAAPGERPEVWAWGLRNPWRASVDRTTGEVWIGDVGEHAREEIDRVGPEGGWDLGWPYVEGTRLVDGGGTCVSDCGVPPVAEYDHGVGESVIGGIVSRRPGAALDGRYLFGDWVSGSIWDVPADVAAGPLPAPFATGRNIVSFGEGADGRIYVVSGPYGGRGAIHRVAGS